jgi:hypothetical protein
MKKMLVLLIVLLAMAGISQQSTVQAQSHQVTFILNTATVPDTLPVTGSNLQMRGALVNSGTSPITWGNDSVNNMTHIGGDYWSKTITMNANDTLKFKFVVAYISGTGWEQNTTPPYAGMPADNRYFIVPDQDTTVDVEYWNNGANGAPQFFRPWTATSDTMMSVYVRVNMIAQDTSGTFHFNPAVDSVGVRGGGPGGGDLNWSPTFYLTTEAPATNGDGYTVPAKTFWSGRVQIPKNGVTEGQSISYKFLIGADWGRDELQGQPNRSFIVPVGKKDTTLHWVYFNNDRPIQRANPDTVIITYRVDMAKAIENQGFQSGDTLYVRSGYFGSAVENARRKTMQNLISSLYQVKDTVVTKIGANLDYQYYVVKNSTEIRESYYNYTFTGDVAAEAERRQFLVPSNTFSVLDTAQSITSARRQPVFPNTRALNRNVLVTYTVDVRPAIYQVWAGDTLAGIQGTRSIYPTDRDSIIGWGVWTNGDAVGGWNNPTGSDWGQPLRENLRKKMYDDGSHGDAVAGDSIFTLTFLYSPDSTTVGSTWRVGQVFKFGIDGGDNEGGKGGFGNNHLENVNDADSVFTVASQWGSINPGFYKAWDYDNHRPANPTGVVDERGFAREFALSQNYPNPFNPSTRIQYSVPTASFVTLKVYNLLGQQVASLVDERKESGTYRVTFDASHYPSGVFFYRITAGSFVSTKKMLLMK